jgi:RNA polymerase sigma-70 factor (ECF subfamily)
VEVNGKFSARALEDLDLVAKAREGDQVAFDKLMTRYRESIFFMVLKMVHNRDDADDLTIEAFGKAFQNIAN